MPMPGAPGFLDIALFQFDPSVSEFDGRRQVVSRSLSRVMYGQFSMISGCQCGELLRWSAAVVAEPALADHVGCFDPLAKDLSLGGYLRARNA